MDETQIEEEENDLNASRISNATPGVKRTASISSPRTNINSLDTASSMATQTEAKSPLQQQQQQQQQQLQREDSFVRTGSGRKLPKIPTTTKNMAKAAAAEQQKTSADVNSRPLRDPLAPEEEQQDPTTKEAKAENRKSKPKALQFWESLINPSSSKTNLDHDDDEDDDEDDDDFAMVDDDDDNVGGDFRYNTIHRMSMGRRMLPRPPAVPTAAQRSQSLDRNGELAAASAARHAAKIESTNSNTFNMLNSSFSGPTSLPNGHDNVQEDASGSDQERGRSREKKTKASADLDKIEVAKPEHEQDKPSSVAHPAQPSPPSSDSRGEVEGSSDNNSPPTSVIQGLGADVGIMGHINNRGNSGNPALDWLRGSSFDGKAKVRKKYFIFLAHEFPKWLVYYLLHASN